MSYSESNPHPHLLKELWSQVSGDTKHTHTHGCPLIKCSAFFFPSVVFHLPPSVLPFCLPRGSLEQWLTIKGFVSCSRRLVNKRRQGLSRQPCISGQVTIPFEPKPPYFLLLYCDTYFYNNCFLKQVSKKCIWRNCTICQLKV